MAKCRKCGKLTTSCASCNGGKNLSNALGRLTCSTCASTGQVCPDHGKHWN
ncbi:hypothetical protein GCM10012320_32860 [Sinomonas cellulolyticus]|nr:hypothetical protein GCM10012320_32860 [Sinomonas sp. KCTC 49339]